MHFVLTYIIICVKYKKMFNELNNLRLTKMRITKRIEGGKFFVTALCMFFTINKVLVARTCRRQQKHRRQIIHTSCGFAVVSFVAPVYNYISRGVWFSSSRTSKAMQSAHVLSTTVWCRKINPASIDGY